MAATVAEKIDLFDLTACHACDLLIEKQPLNCIQK
jgi:hypothetical protein